MTMIVTHIWQSTLFTAVAALVAFALRKNRAQVRYCVWLSASLKFAVPFSMFVALGSHIPWQPSARPQVSSAMLQIARPLQAIPVLFPAPPQTTPAPGPIPMLMLAIWLIGSLLVLLRWARSWLRVRSAVLSAVPLSWETPHSRRGDVGSDGAGCLWNFSAYAGVAKRHHTEAKNRTSASDSGA